MIIPRGKKFGVKIYRDKRQVWVGTFETRRKARQAEINALAEKRGPSTDDETCQEMVERWLTTCPRPSITTQKLYKSALKPFAAKFGERQLSDITKDEARIFAIEKPSSVRVARTMVNQLLEDQPGAWNPFSKMGLPQSRGRKDITALTESEVQDLAATAAAVLPQAGPTMSAMIIVAAYTGIRPGELFLLKHDDIDSEDLWIRRSLNSSREIVLPKNKTTRKIVLPPAAIAAIRSLPRRLNSEYVFTTPRGSHFGKTSHYYYWNLVRMAAGLPEIDFYDLRHHCATQLLRMGVSPEDVAIQLGHQDRGKLVRERYGHPEDELARDRIKNAWRGMAPVYAKPLALIEADDDASVSRVSPAPSWQRR